MYRGTTPVHTITFDEEVDLTEWEQIWVTYESRGNERTFTIDELVVDAENSSIKVMFTQEDTLAFMNSDTCEIQLRFRKSNGKAGVTNIISNYPIGRILKDGVI